MTKLQFILELRGKLSGMPKADMEERLTFYSEMIEDRMEEGLTEKQAVEEIGSVDEIASQILDEIPLKSIKKEISKTKKQLKVWEIVLLVLGFPLWFSLIIAAVVVIASIYVSWCSVIVFLWAAFGAVSASTLCILVGIFGVVYGGFGLSGVFMIGVGFFCGGAAIYLFFVCKLATKITVKYTKKMILAIIKCFFKKEEA